MVTLFTLHSGLKFRWHFADMGYFWVVEDRIQRVPINEGRLSISPLHQWQETP